MTYQIEQYLTALNAASTEVYQGANVVRRGVAKSVAADLGLPCPNWFINAPDNRWKLPQPGRFRVPTLEEAQTALAAAPARKSRTVVSAPTQVQMTSSARPARKTRTPRTVTVSAPAAPVAPGR